MKDFFKGKKVLLTGHTGFKGSWLALWLHSLGADVLGYALEPNTEPSLFKVLNLENKIQSVFGDITDEDHLKKIFDSFRPEIVFHLAAQPLVRLSYAEPVLTYKTNVIGTLNVLEAARAAGSVKAFVNITTDKCYENREISKGYTEDEPMGGYDMYSSSKGCVEIMSASYRRCFLEDSYAMATVRAGNVIGGGDWAQDRLLPDCVRQINEGKTIEIRNPSAVRPWQHVLEPLGAYILLAKLLFTQGAKYAQGFNIGPEEGHVLTVGEIASMAVKFYGKGKVEIRKKDNLHEANLLMLDINKAKRVLGWKPVYTAEQAVEKTIEWYKLFYSGREDMSAFTLSQIKDYEKDLLSWKKN